MKHILKCEKCGKYQLSNPCKFCGGKTFENKPPKYSPDDKYGDYRRKALEESRRSKGLL